MQDKSCGLIFENILDNFLKDLTCVMKNLQASLKKMNKQK